MKLEVGMYVRTKWGIAKYIKELVTKQTIYRIIDKKIVYDNVEDWEDCLLDNEIIKASYDIIELIEVGDYVNGEKVGLVNKFEDDYYIKGEESNSFEIDYEHQKDIKSIVTKEQFESMSYKVN